ncbi:MAG: suppressor of fused domain protein [Butyricicoccus pullicaecorum]|nr:suppressor of fused domain protein [Butyricicoccus pullicaecorum]
MEAAVTAGWDAITQAFLRLYPNQTDPVHYAPMISYRLGGDDPLDGISIYDGGSFYHFVTYGLSELYEKESNQPEYSGFGFELTLKVAKDGIRKREREQKNICGILQTIARMSFESGDIFMPDEYIYTGQTAGIDADGTSQITGFLTMEDPIGTIKTPNGAVQFVQLVGATDTELQMLIRKEKTVSDILAQIPEGITDYRRIAL